MTADELDDYLERARIESASVAAPADFTDRVMRSVRAPASAPAHVDLLTSTVPSGALVASGALLNRSSVEAFLSAWLPSCVPSAASSAQRVGLRPALPSPTR